MAPCPLSLGWAISLRQMESLGHFELLFRRALQCLPQEDVASQRRFRYRDDSLACILGRLMVRRAMTEMDVKWADVGNRLTRTTRGKPIDVLDELRFNVSHQGDVVVLAGSSHEEDGEIGVDVMKIDECIEGAKTRVERLRKAFTPRERESMLKWTTERERWTSFYRHWCLKESVLKATGTGISEDLGALEFRLNDSEDHQPGCLITSTVYYQNGNLQKKFAFEESFIGENHVVAVCRILRGDKPKHRNTGKDHLFRMVDMDFLLETATVIEPLDDGGAEEFAIFDAKKWKPF